MRHRRKGRVLGRSPSHQRAMLRNLASSLVLTEREFEPGEPGSPKVPGRIVTTVAKAKEVPRSRAPRPPRKAAEGRRGPREASRKRV